MTEEQVRGKLRPFESDVRDCIISAWEDFWDEAQLPAVTRLKLTTTAKANILHCFIIARVYEKFDNIKFMQKGVFIRKIKRVVFLDFNGDVILRFKKLSKNKLASFIPTKQSLSYFGQGQFAGMPSAINVIAGYLLSRPQNELLSTPITCPNGKSNAWCFDLEPTLAEIIDLPVQPEPAKQEVIPFGDRIEIKEIKKNG